MKVTTMLLAATGTTPPPPPPPGVGFQRVAQELSSALPDLTLGKAGVLADTVVRTGRSASEAVAAWKSAYTIQSVDKNDATVLSMVTMVAGARPNAVLDAYNAAFALKPFSGAESVDMATRMVLRGYDVPSLKRTYDRLFAISDVSSASAEAITRAAVSANASPDQALDSYAWYRSQPGGTPAQATTWTVDHLGTQAGTFDRDHDQMIAEFTAKVAAVN